MITSVCPRRHNQRALALVGSGAGDSIPRNIRARAAFSIAPLVSLAAACAAPLWPGGLLAALHCLVHGSARRQVFAPPCRGVAGRGLVGRSAPGCRPPRSSARAPVLRVCLSSDSQALGAAGRAEKKDAAARRGTRNPCSVFFYCWRSLGTGRRRRRRHGSVYASTRPPPPK